MSEKHKAAFENFINDIVGIFFIRYVTAYLNNIFIYFNKIDEHKVYVKNIFEALMKAVLYLKPEKLEYHKEEVNYLSLIIRKVSVKVNIDNVALVYVWSACCRTFHIQSFSWFIFFPLFIYNLSEIGCLLVALMEKDIRIKKIEECSKVIKILRKTFEEH